MFGATLELDGNRDDVGHQLRSLADAMTRTLNKYHLAKPYRCVYCDGTEEICEEDGCSTDPEVRTRFAKKIKEDLQDEAVTEVTKDFYEAMAKKTGNSYSDILG